MELLALKLRIEEALHTNDGSRFSHVIVKLKASPKILVATTFVPAFTLTGKSLNPGKEFISYTVLPTYDAGYAIISWDSQGAKAANLFGKSLMNLPNQRMGASLANLVFEVSENFAICPKLWQHLSLGTQEYLYRLFAENILNPREAGQSTPFRGHLPQGILPYQYSVSDVTRL